MTYDEDEDYNKIALRYVYHELLSYVIKIVKYYDLLFYATYY